jgi:hypothetical protein
MGWEHDQRAIRLRYFDRAKKSLANLIVDDIDSLSIFTDFLMQKWEEEETVDIRAVLSTLKEVSFNDIHPGVITNYITILRSINDQGYLYPSWQALDVLVYLWKSEVMREDIESYLVELAQQESSYCRRILKWFDEYEVANCKSGYRLHNKITSMLEDGQIEKK